MAGGRAAHQSVIRVGVARQGDPPTRPPSISCDGGYLHGKHGLQLWFDPTTRPLFPLSHASYNYYTHRGVSSRVFSALPCAWLDAGAGSIWLQSRHAVASCYVRVRGWRVVTACSWVLRSVRSDFGVGELKKSAFAFGSVSVSLRIMLTGHALGRVSVSLHSRPRML